MIDVLVVEDSHVTRDYLVYVLEADPDLRVSQTASNGEEAIEHVERNRPDVVLMDIHLPGIDGFEATRRIMKSNPVPIVVCTASTTFDETYTAMRALEAGALAAVRKPKGLADPGAAADAAVLLSTLKLMSEIKVVRRWRRTEPAAPFVPKPMPREFSGLAVEVVAIGASTGGPPVIARILSRLTDGFEVPILVVQHIAAGFTDGFAEWLGETSGVPVHVAREGDVPRPGHVYVAPDNQHLRVGPNGVLQLSSDEPMGGLRPSVGALFRSVAERFGSRAAGVLLTGMGRDGAEELKLMADQGALTVVQDEASSVVFGMPAQAIELGAARFVFPPDDIAELLRAAVRPAGARGGCNG